MGDYIGATHVEAYNPVRAPFSGTTKPNTTQLTELIAEAEAEINSALEAGGYAVPIDPSATQAFKLVQSGCAKCAAYLVECVAPQTDKTRLDHYRKMCDEAKAMLAAGDLPGIETADGGSGTTRHGFATASPPYFTRDMEL